jgi:hypothetical protein
MAITEPKPIKRLGTHTRATRQHAIRRAERREKKAQERLRVAKLGAAYREQKVSWRDIQDHIEAMVIAGELLRPYSHETIRQLVAAYEKGATSAADFVDRARAGRPSRMDALLRAKIQTAVGTDTAYPVAPLFVEVVEEAKRVGVLPPSYDTVKRYVALQGRGRANAARFGARVSQIEGMVHSTVPARSPHEVWTIDEFDAPWYVRVLDYKRELWCSVRPTVIVVADHHSGVILGYWVADPTRRLDPITKQVMRAGFDASDVLGAMMAAAWGGPLATPACAAFTGWLPRTIRWDNHATHVNLRAILEKLGEKLAIEAVSFRPATEDLPCVSFSEWEEEDVVDHDGRSYSSDQTGIVIPKLPRYRPINRGKIESIVGIAKRLCHRFPSHVDKVVPIDRLKEDLKSLRDQSAGAGSREFRREPLNVMRLPTIEESRAMFDACVSTYNHTSVPKRLHMTRRVYYRSRFDSTQTRRGIDILAALDTKVTLVSTEGIVHHHDGGATEFAYSVDGKFQLHLDTAVTYKAEPLLRGIFANIEERWYWLPPKGVWASSLGRAEEVARQATADSRFYAAEAIAARGAKKDAQYGPGATKADEDEARTRLEQLRKEKSSDSPGNDAEPAAAPPPTATADTAPTPATGPVFKSRLSHLKNDAGQTPGDAVA